MKNEIPRITLEEDTYEYIGRLNNEKNFNIFKNKIQQYISILKEVIGRDFDKLTDAELYELLSKIYRISLDENDYLEMLSNFNNKQYTSIYTIPTTMTFTSVATEGHGRSFDWWNQLYQVYYIAATSDDFEFDYNKTYSKEEIKKLSSNKSIILLNKKSEALNSNRSFIHEEYEIIPTLDIEIKDYGDNVSQFVLNNFNLLGELLRKRFTKQTVLKDLRKMTEELTCEIQDVFSKTQSNDSQYSETAKLCKNWFDSSEEKKEFQQIQKVLLPTEKRLVI